MIFQGKFSEWEHYPHSFCVLMSTCFMHTERSRLQIRSSFLLSWIELQRRSSPNINKGMKCLQPEKRNFRRPPKCCCWKCDISRHLVHLYANFIVNGHIYFWSVHNVYKQGLHGLRQILNMCSCSKSLDFGIHFDITWLNYIIIKLYTY